MVVRPDRDLDLSSNPVGTDDPFEGDGARDLLRRKPEGDVPRGHAGGGYIYADVPRDGGERPRSSILCDDNPHGLPGPAQPLPVLEADPFHPDLSGEAHRDPGNEPLGADGQDRIPSNRQDHGAYGPFVAWARGQLG